MCRLGNGRKVAKLFQCSKRIQGVHDAIHKVYIQSADWQINFGIPRQGIDRQKRKELWKERLAKLSEADIIDIEEWAKDQLGEPMDLAMWIIHCYLHAKLCIVGLVSTLP